MRETKYASSSKGRRAYRNLIRSGIEAGSGYQILQVGVDSEKILQICRRLEGVDSEEIRFLEAIRYVERVQ